MLIHRKLWKKIVVTLYSKQVTSFTFGGPGLVVYTHSGVNERTFLFCGYQLVPLSLLQVFVINSVVEIQSFVCYKFY